MLEVGWQERVRKVDRSLLSAGLEVLPDGVPGAVLPVRAVGAASSYSPEPGVRGFCLAYDAPRLVEQANQQWHELAISIGLFDENREFLLALPSAPLSPQQLRRRMIAGPPVHFAWRRVRLLERWDIMGAGAVGHLGIHSGHPGFFLLSVDGAAVVVGTTWEAGIGAIAVPDPAARKSTRDYLDWATSREDRSGQRSWERSEALAYLRQVKQSGGAAGQAG